MKPNPVNKIHDILHYSYNPLDAIFKPNSVAVIGATDRAGSVGRTILSNLITTPFGGTVYPINPKRKAILGIKAYPNLAAIGDPVELVVIVTPAPTVPDVIRECVDYGVKGAIVISAGFKETGSAGIALEQEILAEAQRGGIRLIGPNCLGVMSPITGFNATFASRLALPGNVGFISQSGALLTSILDWSVREKVGFSAFVSVGSMLDVGWGDLIYYLGNDPNTHSIVIYMETIGNARSFMSAAREVALTKPIIVIKPGRTQAAAAAAASHTGSLTGSDEVLEAAFRRCGVLRVNNISDLFEMAAVLAKQPLPRGKRLTIVTNAGGPGVLATDALISGGGELSPISVEMEEKLNGFLPAHWSHNNPIDVLGDASAERYAQTLELAAADPNSDGLLVILTPQAMSDPTGTATQLKEVAQRVQGKPVLASWMGGAEIGEGEHLLNDAGIPTFSYPDTATTMFNYLWRYHNNLRNLYETPVLPADSDDNSPNRQAISQLIHQAYQAGRTILTEYESKQILTAYGIPTTPTSIATSSDQAIAQAEKMGYPVVLKLHSGNITHKTEANGVQLRLQNAAAVRHAFEQIAAGASQYSQKLRQSGQWGAEISPTDDFWGVTVQPMVKLEGYELIIGSSPDPQFGPVLLFGTGGILVEVYKDRALALPPLNTTLARRMMERTKIYEALQGIRGRKPVDLAALEQLIVRFSQLVVEQPYIKEIDINPLLASPDRLLALDARVVLYPTNTVQPTPLAIRPYPTQYIQPWQLVDGTPVNIRPIRPEDEPLMVTFHKGLSSESVYMRYLHSLDLSQRVAHERLTRICFIDYDREMALVVTKRHPETGERRIIAVGRLSKSSSFPEAEFAMIIDDDHQKQGIGTELLRRLLAVAKDEKLARVIAYMLPDNVGMRKVCERLGFRFKYEDGLIAAMWENTESHLA